MGNSGREDPPNRITSLVKAVDDWALPAALDNLGSSLGAFPELVTSVESVPDRRCQFRVPAQLNLLRKFCDGRNTQHLGVQKRERVRTHTRTVWQNCQFTKCADSGFLEAGILPVLT